jgi:hypothetical protein
MNYLYFAALGAAGTGKGAMYPASSFIGLDPISSTTTRLSFKSRNNAGVGDDDVLLTHTAGKHKEVGELIASVLAPSPVVRTKFIVVADQDNSVYLDNGNGASLTGAVTITTLA